MIAGSKNGFPLINSFKYLNFSIRFHFLAFCLMRWQSIRLGLRQSFKSYQYFSPLPSRFQVTGVKQSGGPSSALLKIKYRCHIYWFLISVSLDERVKKGTMQSIETQRQTQKKERNSQRYDASASAPGFPLELMLIDICFFSTWNVNKTWLLIKLV